MSSATRYRNHYGRGCLCCSHEDADVLDALLAQGGSIADLSRRFDVSRDSLYRHLTWHLRPALADSIKQSPEVRPAALVERIAAIANDARQARRSAYDSGNAWLGARLGAAELQAISALADRFKITHDDAAEDLAVAASIVRAIRVVGTEDPGIRDALAAAFDQDNRPDLAAEMRALTFSETTHLEVVS